MATVRESHQPQPMGTTFMKVPLKLHSILVHVDTIAMELAQFEAPFISAPIKKRQHPAAMEKSLFELASVRDATLQLEKSNAILPVLFSVVLQWSDTGVDMDDTQGSEETTFIIDEVKQIIQESVENVLGASSYQNNKVNQWTSSIVEQCLNQLTKLGKPFKYIVTSVIMQKNGAGLHTASSCYWDNTTDGSCTIRWENKSMYCIVTVFGLAI